MFSLYPDEGPLRRELYPKHMAFFSAPDMERCMMAANRIGKTLGVGGYETTLHLTGLYPEWWPGRRFEHPIEAWVAGDTLTTTRDIVQSALLGPVGEFGTGLIPADCLAGDPVMKSGVPGGVDFLRVKHASGAASLLGFKCFGVGMLVKMANGSLRPIERVQIGDQVLCADGSPRTVVETHAYLKAPLLEIVTRSGSIRVTPNHRMFTVNRGECLAGDLVEGDVLEIASPSVPGTREMEDWRVKLTALMIGDGCMRSRTPFFTCNEPPIVDEVRRCLPPELYVVPINGTISYKISSTEHKDNWLKTSLERDGLWGTKAKDKFIPAWVFGLSVQQKKVFLRWLWGCDGGVTTKDATYVTSSYRLAHDVRLLLWDLGIHAPVKSHIVSNQSRKQFQSYYLTLHGENRLRFNEIGKLNRSIECKLKPRTPGPLGEVRSVEKIEDGSAFCVTVEAAHELVAEGYRVGNSYDQGRKTFQGTAKHVCWLDEEPSRPVYDECMMRLVTTNGLMLCTFTPLLGLSEVALMFLPHLAPEAA